MKEYVLENINALKTSIQKLKRIKKFSCMEIQASITLILFRTSIISVISQNKISFKLAFSSAFIKLKLLCKHCSITYVFLSKSIFVHVFKTSNGQSFNDFRYCKHVLM